MSVYEGFGLPVQEAMQCGTPVVCSNTTSIPKVSGSACISIDPTDNDELSQAMKIVFDDEDLRKNLSNKGLERAKNFSWEKTTEKYQEIFSEIIKARA